MHVLQVVSDLHPRNGGPPAVVVGTALALTARGHKVSIAARSKPGDEPLVRSAWPDLQRQSITLKMYPASFPDAILQSRSFVTDLNTNCSAFDIVHFHGVWETMMSSAGHVLTRHRRPYIVSTHGTLDTWARQRSSWKKQLALRGLGGRAYLDQAAAIVFGTASERDEASDMTLKAPTYVLPNGYNFDQERPPNSKGVKQLHERFPHMRNWDRTLLFFARIHPKKGLDVLVEAFLQVSSIFPNSGLLIAGIAQDHGFEAQLRKRIRESPASKQFVFTTELTGTAGKVALDVADVFVLPSHAEGFSMAILEAMAAGLPVLITDRCHLDDVMDWNAGWVVPPNVQSVRNGLHAAMAANTATLKAMGKAARQAVEMRYSWSNVSEQLESIYRDAMRAT
jgi:glycosyltransferase involved in cell wall biosynthesis